MNYTYIMRAVLAACLGSSLLAMNQTNLIDEAEARGATAAENALNHYSLKNYMVALDGRPKPTFRLTGYARALTQFLARQEKGDNQKMKALALNALKAYFWAYEVKLHEYDMHAIITDYKLAVFNARLAYKTHMLHLHIASSLKNINCAEDITKLTTQALHDNENDIIYEPCDPSFVEPVEDSAKPLIPATRQTWDGFAEKAIATRIPSPPAIENVQPDEVLEIGKLLTRKETVCKGPVIRKSLLSETLNRQ